MLGQQPFGIVLLWVMAVGLLALVLWQGLEVVGGRPGADTKDQLKNRGKAAGKAVVYLVLGLTAARIAAGAGSSSGSGPSSTRWPSVLWCSSSCGTRSSGCRGVLLGFPTDPAPAVDVAFTP